MSSIFKKNLHLCLFKIKCLPTSLSPPLTLDNDDEDDQDPINIVSNNTTSYNNNNNNNDTFNSTDDLYTTPSTTSSTTSSSSIAEDYSTVFASQRLFVSSPGCSNSILDSCSCTVGGECKTVVGGGIPVKKYSPDPYVDFRRSMHEMIEAREREKDEDDEWEFLNELLLCYLKLNPKHNHKYIFAAFSDVLVSVLSSATPTGHCCSIKIPTSISNIGW